MSWPLLAREIKVPQFTVHLALICPSALLNLPKGVSSGFGLLISGHNPDAFSLQ
jgi:hypothetical protein